MKVALVQFSPEWEAPERNVEKLREMLNATNPKGVDLLVLPELTLTGFTMNSKKFAEEIDGISFRFFIEIARKYKCNVFGGLIEKDENKIFNSLIHFSPEGLIMARYRKIHPFTFAKEDKFFDSGDEPVISFIGKNKTKIGLTICYDLRFPELYRIYALQGAEIIVNIANWPEQRIKHWDLLLKANAVFSQSVVIGVNRVGSDPYNNYPGMSMVVSPKGEVVNEISNEEKIIFAEFETEDVTRIRKELPFLKDTKLIELN